MSQSRVQIPEEGFVFLVDKPYGWTSFQVVNKVRWLLSRATGVKKSKVGHAGTLDPLATGLLVLCAGKKTKSIEAMLNSNKTYKGSGILGYQSPSYDLEKRVTEVSCNPYSEEEVQQAANQFIGKIQQTPPVFSAKKVNGKKAYLLAREGKEVEMKKASIEIFSFEITEYNFPHFSFEVSCSKGTYIRSLVHDLGQALNTHAVMTALRRTQSGEFAITDSVQKEDWLKGLHTHLVPNEN